MWSTSRYRPPTVNYWPSFLDAFTAALMVFVLSTYLQIALKLEVSAGDEEALRVRQQQDEFLTRLNVAFAPDIRDGHLAAERSLAAIQLRFSEVVLFATGDYRLNAKGKTLLNRMAGFLATSRSGVRRIQVEGHTDDVA